MKMEVALMRERQIWELMLEGETEIIERKVFECFCDRSFNPEYYIEADRQLEAGMAEIAILQAEDKKK